VTAAAHVAEGTLAGPVGTASTDTGNTGHSATGTPGLGTGLVTSITVYSISLAMILSNFMVDEADNVGPDGGLEDCGEADGGVGGLVLLRVNGDQGTCR